MRSVASQFGVSLHTVQHWVAHSAGQRLDRVDWSGARGGRRETQATSSEVEGLEIGMRTQLRDHSDLGEFGAAAIHRELTERREQRAERDSFDFIEDLVIKGGIDVNVLNGISLHGGLCASWVMSTYTAKI